jgi:signal-transduction protein with cAMP-binding, CBS, and nucleotidyltransferase domain
MTVAEILKSKGSNVYSITSDITVYDALIIMGDKNVGALLVIENEQLLGIISERDYARKIILKGKTSQETPVSEIMTGDVICVSPEDNIEKCMELMSEKHIRHLPRSKGRKSDRHHLHHRCCNSNHCLPKRNDLSIARLYFTIIHEKFRSSFGSRETG